MTHRACSRHAFGGVVDWRAEAEPVARFFPAAIRLARDAQARSRRLLLRDKFGRQDFGSDLVGYVGHLLAAEKLGLTLSDQAVAGDGGIDFTDGSGCKTTAYLGAWNRPRLRVKVSEVRLVLPDGEVRKASKFPDAVAFRAAAMHSRGFKPHRFHLVAIEKGNPDDPETWRGALVGTARTSLVVLSRVTDPGDRGAPCFEVDEEFVVRKVPGDECRICGARRFDVINDPGFRKGGTGWATD